MLHKVCVGRNHSETTTHMLEDELLYVQNKGVIDARRYLIDIELFVSANYRTKSCSYLIAYTQIKEGPCRLVTSSRGAKVAL